MTGAVVVLASLAHDFYQLHDLIADTMRRQPVPCQPRDEATRALWTGTAAEQTAAALACSHCPVIVQCRDYGLTQPQRKETTMTTSTQGSNAHTETDTL